MFLNMGSRHSNMHFSNPVNMLNCSPSNTCIYDHNYSHHQLNANCKCNSKLPVFTRLNSIGDEIDSNSSESSSISNQYHQKGTLDPTHFNVGNRHSLFRSHNFVKARDLGPTLYSKSLTRSTQSPFHLNLSGSEHQKRDKMLKSHSMSEVPLTSNFCDTHVLKHSRANRSWSFGPSELSAKTPEYFGGLDDPRLDVCRSGMQSICENIRPSVTNSLPLNIAVAHTSYRNHKQTSYPPEPHHSNSKKLLDDSSNMNFSSGVSNCVDIQNLPVSLSQLVNDKEITTVKSPLVSLCSFFSMENQNLHEEEPQVVGEGVTVSQSQEDGVNCLQSNINETSDVLYSPRKTCKKGRPSSKKQRKRNRQKLKSASLKSEVTSSKIFENNKLDSLVDSDTDSENGCRPSFSVIVSDNLSNDSLSPKYSTPVKSGSFASSFASGPQCSDTEEDETDEWAFKDETDSPVSMSPIPGFGFSIALNLDSIFKQDKIPNLTHLLSSTDPDNESQSSKSASSTQNSVCVSVSVLSLSDPDCSLNDSIEFTISSSPPVNFHQSQDSVSLQNLTDSLDGVVESHKDVSSHTDWDLVDLSQLNSDWDEFYSDTETCTCCHQKCGNPSAVKDVQVKVRFEENDKLNTIHAIGNEDRAGTWHHFALDRERFERRIMEASQIISPILDNDHRVEIFKRFNLPE